jgi:hypothetical protein
MILTRGAGITLRKQVLTHLAAAAVTGFFSRSNMIERT